MSTKTITINPITRLEGHGKIEIFLNEEGNVENAYFQVPELKGFERFCEGRKAEDVPVTVKDEILKILEEKKWKERIIPDPTLLPRLIRKKKE